MTRGQLLKTLRALAQSRHNQRKSPWFTAEGLRCCREALARRPEWLEAAVIADSAADTPAGAEFARRAADAGAPPERVPDGDFAALAATENPQGMLCLLRKPAESAPAALSRPCTLILDQLREPGNLGTLLRTAWAVGLASVWLTAGSADPWSPKAVRSGMGAQFALDVHHFADLAAARDAHRRLGGTALWCAMMDAPTTIFSPDFAPDGAAIVLGNEANGISRPELGRPVTIPMPGAAESLNVAQAGTLFLYEALRRTTEQP